MKKIFSIVALLLMAATGAMAQTETLLTTITATAKEQASYSTANVATVSFSYTAGGSSAYLANWGWWGYGWSATVTAAEGYTITKCIFYDDANRTATDSEAPFVVETTEEDKTPQVNGTPILSYTSKGITKIDVYGYANPTTVAVTGVSLSQTEAAMTLGGDALTLTTTVAPDNATDKTVTWTTSDASVATVADGVVTAVAAGTATITATATNGTPDDTSDDFSATCTVTVADAATKYDLTLADGSEAHGTVAFTVGGAAADKAKKDDVVTVTVTPAEGYSTKDVTVRAYTGLESADARGMRRAIELLDNITVTPGENGTWSFTMPEANVWVVVTYTKNLQDAWIQAIADQTYTGSAIEPTIEVKDGETTLTLNTDYTVAYSNNTNAGTATVTITAVAGSDYSGTATKTFTISKADITMTTAPAAIAELTYSGEAQTLITAGVASFGTVVYSLDGTTFSDGLPRATDAGTYTVYYKVEGDANHNALAAQTLTVTIAKAAASVTTAPVGKNLTYTGEAQALIEAGTANGGEMQYSLDGESYSADIPTAAEQGTYTVYYKVVGDANHNDTDAQSVPANITGVTFSISAVTYVTHITNQAISLSAADAAAGVKLYTVTAADQQAGTVTLAELTSVDANTPMIVYNPTDADRDVVFIPATGTMEAQPADIFKGTINSKTFTDGDMGLADHYVLSHNNFVWVKDAGTLAGGKCWIELTKAAGARRLSIVAGGEATGIDLAPVLTEGEGAWYDLNGRRVVKPTKKGLYIKNGKKYVVK